MYYLTITNINKYFYVSTCVACVLFVVVVYCLQQTSVQTGKTKDCNIRTLKSRTIKIPKNDKKMMRIKHTTLFIPCSVCDIFAVRYKKHEEKEWRVNKRVYVSKLIDLLHQYLLLVLLHLLLVQQILLE